MNVRHPLGVLDSSSIKTIFYNKMGLRLFYFHFTKSTIIHKIYETKTSFHMKIDHYQKSLISVFQEFFASINKIFILAGRLGTSLSIYEV